MGRKNEYTEQIDKIIAGRIHELRISMGLSRQQLSEKIGVTHQQVQKYEKGVNRISAGRLASIAKELNETVAYFFEGLEEDPVPNQHQRMCIEVARNFMQIKSAQYQTAIHTLVKSLAE